MIGLWLIRNVAGSDKDVSVRYLWDTKIDGDNGPRVGSDSISLTREAAWNPPTSFIYGRNNEGTPVFTARYGSAFLLPIPNAIVNSPSQIVNARWLQAVITVFGYTPNSAQSTDDDNALLFYFGPITVPITTTISCECEISIVDMLPVAGVVLETPKLSIIARAMF